jgi:hypothetical protein
MQEQRKKRREQKIPGRLLLSGRKRRLGSVANEQWSCSLATGICGTRRIASGAHQWHRHFHWPVLYYYDQRFTPCHPSPQLFTGFGVHSSAITRKFLYMVVRRTPDQKFWHFSPYLGLKIAKSLSPRSKLFSSWPSVTRHLNLWS